MKRLLGHAAAAAAAVQMKERFWFFIKLGINLKVLFFAGAFLTTAGVALQTRSLPFPLTTIFGSPPIRVFSYRNLNGTGKLTEAYTQARVEQFQHAPTPPFVSSNYSNESPPVRVFSYRTLNATFQLMETYTYKARTRQFQHVPAPDLVVSLNSSNELVQSMSRREKRKQHRAETPPPPPAPPPPQPRPTRLQQYLWSLSPGDALLYARMEMERAPIVTNDSDLHAPLFRNVSIFKRTYELMEMILKVYIYPDGKKPIFHTPLLKGIYASEGWFLKLMEENKQFVTRNPEEAHLFFLPYSAKQLEWALYVPGSHTLRPLSVFMRDYTNMLATKYAFWNCTQGRDHFLVACHDWGPYTLMLHEELKENTIKALCNADYSEGIFKAGKDVSLPETSIRIPRNPHRNVGGGLRVSKRSILAFFSGHMHGRVRPKLLKYWSDRDEDMRIYGPLPGRVSRNMSYIQHMRSSKYCICPRGYEVNSPRIVEAIYYECIPVIIADNFVPPLNEVLDWSAFSVFVAEKDIPKLKEILLAIPIRKYLRMLHNLKMLQKHFLWNRTPIRYDLFHMILHSIWFSRLNHFEITES